MIKRWYLTIGNYSLSGMRLPSPEELEWTGTYLQRCLDGNMASRAALGGRVASAKAAMPVIKPFNLLG